MTSTSRPWARTGLALAFAVPALTGCYSYSQVPIESAPMNESVRVTVTRAGALDLLNVVETSDAAPSFVGQIEGTAGESLLVRIPVASDPASTQSGVRIGQRIRVPTNEILAVERREIDPLKTGGVVAAAAGLGTFIILQILSATNNDDGRDGPDVDFSILRLLSIPIG